MVSVFKKRDLILIAGLAVLTGCLLWLLPLFREKPIANAPLYLRYSIHGDVVETISLVEEKDLTINQGDGVINILRLSPKGFVMTSATCHNQLCVFQGEVTMENMEERSLYHMIVCAPHRLVAELLTADQIGGESP